MSEWISVKEKMPTEYEYVLIFDGGDIQIDSLVDDQEKPGLIWEYNFDNPGITHWMPLPEPPQ